VFSLRQGKIFWLRLTTASTHCLRLSECFFHLLMSVTSVVECLITSASIIHGRWFNIHLEASWSCLGKWALCGPSSNDDYLGHSKNHDWLIDWLMCVSLSVFSQNCRNIGCLSHSAITESMHLLSLPLSCNVFLQATARNVFICLFCFHLLRRYKSLTDVFINYWYLVNPFNSLTLLVWRQRASSV